MLELFGTRFRNGYSAFGPPPVARIELRPAPAPDPGACLERLRGLEREGLIGSPVAGEGASNAATIAQHFGSLVARLLERGGHRCGQPQVETGSGARDKLFVNLPCEEPESAEKAVELAARLLFDPPAERGSDRDALASFLDFANARLPHPDTRRLIRVARGRGLPVMRLDQAPFETSPEDRPFRAGLIRIGHGIRGRVLAGAVQSLAADKLLRVTNRELLVTHLRRHDVPLPAQDLEFPNKNRAARAVRAAQRLAGPISLRAIHRQAFAHARGCTPVYEPLTQERQIVAAYEAASAYGRNVWVEAHVGGDRLRCLIIAGKLVAATRAGAPAITGDGRRSVAELIADAARAAETPHHRHAWKTIAARDRDVRARLLIAGAAPASVLESGRTIALRGEGTVFNGGELEDVLVQLSEPIRRLVERTAAACGMNEIAAVDLAVVDPAGLAEPPNCHVLDVVPDPDLQSHIECRPESGDRLAEQLVDALFPTGRPARIPTLAITGTNGKTTTSRMSASILRRAYRHVGLSTTEGAFINDEPLMFGDVAGVSGAALVLVDERTEAAVLETARGDLQSHGTAMEAVDAAACLNIASDHVGIDGINSLDELAEVKARVLELADGHQVVNADDPRCLAMLGAGRAARPVLVSRAPDSRAVRDHLAAGCKAVLIDQAGDGSECLVFAQGEDSEALMPTHDIPAVMNGLLPFNAQNAAFAAALCWSLGVDTRFIREGLERFSNSTQGNPGRYNFIEGYPFTLLTDFAQNAHGLAELYRVIEKLPTRGKKRLVCLTIGSRHREHIDENAGDLLEHFDSLVIGCSDYADSNPEYAGGSPRETMLAHFRQRLIAAGADSKRFETHAAPETAIRRGLETAGPGDLLVILGSPKLVLPALEAREKS